LVGLVFPVLRLFFLSPEKGADTIIYLASSLEVTNSTGGYFVKRKITEPSAAAQDAAAAKRLWEASETLAGAESQTGVSLNGNLEELQWRPILRQPRKSTSFISKVTFRPL